MTDKKQSLKIGISGVRGIVGESLTPQLLVSFAEAFASYVRGGKVLVATDTRTSKEMVKNAIFSGLLAGGCEPVDLGICPVPTILIRTKYSGASGGIAITASHNPAEWNALKFVNKDGLFLNANQAEELLDVYHQREFFKCTNADMKRIRTDDGAIEFHMEKVLGRIDADAIRRRKLRVAVDCCNGAASLMSPVFLKRLGCRVIPINTEPNGIFPHDPEPIPKNLIQISRLIRSKGADIGFVQDADADRLAVVDEKGRPVGEEYTLVMAVDHILGKKKGTVVTNLSATRAINDVAERYGCKVIRTKIGEINVVENIINRNAVIGGEGNGGVIWPAVHPCRDSFSGMAVILEHLAGTKKAVSEIIKGLPSYHMVKGKTYCETAKAHFVVGKFRDLYKKDKPVLLDGVKVDREDHWVHVRPSNTEPIIRVIVEAKTKKLAEAVFKKTLEDLSALLRKS
ncbi:MAG: phosphoglucosamine mutase [Candidatus Omnitrophica bacterium]|nr:phosphoglucosamine mutase [Candidatus Omnitrophota bacterium]